MAALHEIEKALGAHSVFKLRLKGAIEGGRCDTPIPGLKVRECTFSKWLHGPTIAPSTRASAHYTRVRDLHAQVHEAAVFAVELAVRGHQPQALLEITGNGEFAQRHRALTAALLEWKESLVEGPKRVSGVMLIPPEVLELERQLQG